MSFHLPYSLETPFKHSFAAILISLTAFSSIQSPSLSDYSTAMLSPARQLPFGWLFSATFLSLAYIHNPVTFAQAECLPLSNSKVCPAFKQYSVDLSNMRQQYPTLMANVRDIQSFDEQLLTAHILNDFLITQPGCSSSISSQRQQQQQQHNHGSDWIRYTLTWQCAIVTQNRSCNKNVDPPRLCQTTCNASAESVTNELAVADLCRSNSSSIKAYLADQCAHDIAYNGTTADSCISGSINEPDFCGFRSDVNRACQYCRSNRHGEDDSCCAGVLSVCGYLSDDSLSSATVTGIIVGSLVLGTLLCGLVFYFGILRKTKKRELRKDVKSRGLEKDTNSVSGQTLVVNTSTVDGDGKFESRLSRSKPLQEQPSPRTITSSMVPESLFTAIHMYPPQQQDEVMLHPGDILMVIMQFDDGWGFGYNLSTGQKGALPMICVAPFSATACNNDDKPSLAFQQSLIIPGEVTDKDDIVKDHSNVAL
ncbi:hypothetical protein BX666DRAFT_1917106 [Dichotomocladium elegans]|nr:hypothetical protein BX666DRAFT_1917106 [Dichotomocladium elegans]